MQGCPECGGTKDHRSTCARYRVDTPTPKVPLIVDPRTGDTARAQDILDELQAVLKKYGYALAIANPPGPGYGPKVIALAKVDGPAVNVQARVVAIVKQITPYMIEYDVVDWSKQLTGVRL